MIIQWLQWTSTSTGYENVNFYIIVGGIIGLMFILHEIQQYRDWVRSREEYKARLARISAKIHADSEKKKKEDL